MITFYALRMQASLAERRLVFRTHRICREPDSRCTRVMKITVVSSASPPSSVVNGIGYQNQRDEGVTPLLHTIAALVNLASRFIFGRLQSSTGLSLFVGVASRVMPFTCIHHWSSRYNGSAFHLTDHNPQTGHENTQVSQARMRTRFGSFWKAWSCEYCLTRTVERLYSPAFFRVSDFTHPVAQQETTPRPT